MADKRTENKVTEQTVKVIQMQFEDAKPLRTTENRNGYVTYGEKNTYAEYLLDLFENSPKHGAITRGKANFTIGRGFAFKEQADDAANKKAKALIDKANKYGETLTDVCKKLALDIEIFEGGYLQIIYNTIGKVSEIYHLDFTKVRASKDLQTFYFSEEWTKEYCGRIVENGNPKLEAIPAFDPENPKKKQLLYVRGYSPKAGTYPKPNYYACLRYIQIDILISKYYLSGISNGMFVSKMINFNNGVPADNDKKTIEKDVNNKFSGAENAGKIMISYNRDKEHAPTVTDLSSTEIDKHFDQLNKTTQQEIFTGHRVTSGMIFGVKTEGQLGGRTELREATELFQNTYVDERRELIEKNVNAVLKINKIPTVYLQRSEAIGFELSQGAIEGVMTGDEKREKIGLKPLEQEQTPAGSNEPAAEEKKFSSDELNDDADILVFSEYGRARNGYDIVSSEKMTNNIYQQFAETTATLTKNQKSIIDLLTKDPKTTPEAISKVMGISTKAVEALLKGMEADGLIKTNTVKSGEDDVIERQPTSKGNDGAGSGKEPATTSIRVMYSYAGPKDSRNRPFCAKMMDLDRLYTREEIEQISARVGYSVFDRRGGWYKPKGATEARPYCRHNWEINTVIERKAA